MSEPETGHPLWLHVNKRCPQSCPYCDIAELQAELAELREALTSISTALDAYGVRWCRDVAKAALQEKGE